MEDQIDDNYLDIRFHVMGGEVLQLKVPVVWDPTKNNLMAFYRFKNGEIVHSNGKDSFELQNNFNIALKKYMESEKGEDALEEFTRISR